MLKRTGLLIVMLAVALILISPPAATAQVRVGFGVAVARLCISCIPLRVRIRFSVCISVLLPYGYYDPYGYP